MQMCDNIPGLSDNIANDVCNTFCVQPPYKICEKIEN